MKKEGEIGQDQIKTKDGEGGRGGEAMLKGKY